MFDLNCRFQIAAICFFVIIVIDYLKNKKLLLLSTKFFTLMLIFAGINLCFDVATVYTITHMSEVPQILNRICHQFFIGTLIIIMVSLYLYVEILGHNQKRMGKKKLLLTMFPFIISMIMVVFGDLYYYANGNVIYSYGPMASTLYIAIVFYIVLIVADTYIYRENIKEKRRSAIRRGILIWVTISIVQFFNPQLLMSGLAVVLMILFLYLSFENQKEHIDEVTGTFNKRAFHLMLTEKVASGKTVFFVNVVVDDFNRIQTMVGHDNINQLLEIIGNKMKNTFQTNVFHSKSNVLTIMLEKDIDFIKTQIQPVEVFIKEPINISQYSILMKVHIDIINSTYCKNSVDEVYEIMKYMAEQNRPSDSCIRVLDDNLANSKLRYTTIEKMLNNAIENDGFQVVYQPIFDVKENKFHSAEALVRLKDTTTVGFVSPDEFIQIAEKKGMILELGRIVFEKVCQFFNEKELQKLGIKYMDVNLSSIQCMHPDLSNQLQDIMQKNSITPEFINLEITETAFVESGEMLHRNMLQLREIGCNFSMDDFGTGYSNLSQMADAVYDQIKLDKSLIWSCFYGENKKSFAILENVIKMLIELNVMIVAEGVETIEMRDYLSNQGVKYLQGYYYSKPLQEEDFLSFLNVNNAM